MPALLTDKEKGGGKKSLRSGLQDSQAPSPIVIKVAAYCGVGREAAVEEQFFDELARGLDDGAVYRGRALRTRSWTY